ncbi:MAG: right-handed parallel beta-helix repeat-containing protein [Bacteroidetes bacterium]|nr:right-handed parallel beta-helix repeat-containing protein [Bacteroidota bacterium]
MSLVFQPLTAQPSGGPYGPIRQAFELPGTAGKVYYVSQDGKADNSGETISAPTTLEAAIERVKTNDAVILRGGVYRTGNLLLNQGITIQSYLDELPVIKGTAIADNWINLGNGLWKTHWDQLFPSKPDDWWRRDTEGKRTPLHRFNNDMVFADGVFLQSSGWQGEVDESSYYIDYETGTVFIGIDPAKHVIEITAHNSAIRRITGECHGKKSDHKGPVIMGITFTQFARCAIEVDGKEPEGISGESEHGKDVIGTTFEHCTISYCSRVAAYLRGDRLTIRHCKVSDTSTEGIYIIASSDVLLEKNIFTRNNIENITGYYPAAVKIFNQCYRVTCRDNFVTDLPNSNGIWYDVGNVDGVFINNWIEKVGKVDKEFPLNRLWPSDNGFFFEISKGVICAGNVFVDCDHGMMILNSSNARIYQNTFINSMACIGRNGRVAEGDHFGWHPSTGPAVEKREGHVFVNNLLTGNEDYSRPLLHVWQPAELCTRLSKPQLKECDHNVYVRDSKQLTVPLVLWSPAKNNECQYLFNSLEELNKSFSEFSANSRYFTDCNNRLFKNPALNNFQLLKEFPGASLGTQIPDEIIKLLGYKKKAARFAGAYPAE